MAYVPQGSGYSQVWERLGIQQRPDGSFFVPQSVIDADPYAFGQGAIKSGMNSLAMTWTPPSSMMPSWYGSEGSDTNMLPWATKPADGGVLLPAGTQFTDLYRAPDSDIWDTMIPAATMMFMGGGIGSALGGLSGGAGAGAGAAEGGALAADWAGLDAALGSGGAWGGGAGAAGSSAASGAAQGGGMWDWLTNLFSSGTNAANADLSAAAAMGGDLADWVNLGNIGAGAGTAGGANWLTNLLSTPGLGTAASTLGNLFGGGAGAAGGLGGGSALGALLGGLAGYAGTPDSGTQTVTSISDIPDWLKPYVNTGLQNLQSAYQASQPGQVDPLTAQAKAYQSSVIGGDYLNSNPYLDAMFQAASAPVVEQFKYATAPSTDAMFARSKAFGDSAYNQYKDLQAGALGRTLGNLSANIYGNNYQQERSRQQQSATTAPDFSSAYLQQPMLSTDSYLKAIGNIAGRQSTTNTPYYSSPLGGALSGALAGYNLGRVFGG